MVFGRGIRRWYSASMHASIAAMRPGRCRTVRARSRFLAAGVALAAALAGIVIVAGPASADVTSSDYTIGSPTGAVSDVVASPGTVLEGSSTNFEVNFTVGPSLSGSSAD